MGRLGAGKWLNGRAVLTGQRGVLTLGHVERVLFRRGDAVSGNWLALGGLAVAGGLLLAGAGLLSDARTPVVSAADQGPPPLPAAPVAPTFPAPGSTCYAYFESLTVAGAGASTVILGYPTEKAVQLSQYAIAHGDHAMLEKSQQVLSRVDPGARLRVIARTASSVQGTVLNGSSEGQTVFIPQDECHAVWPISIVEEK